jgi:hypothetical protein
MEVIAQRQGLENAQAAAKRVADLSGADESLIAAVESQGGVQALLVAKHDQEGKLEVVARLPLPENIDSDTLSSSVRRLGASLFVDRQTGELEVTDKGDTRPGSGITAALFGRGGGAALAQSEPVRQAETEHAEAEEKPLPKGAENGGGRERRRGSEAATKVEKVESQDEDRPITKEWWFWAGAGAAVVTVAVVSLTLLLRPAASSTTFEINVR